MTTRTKLNIASFTSSVMVFLNVFSHPLGISNGVQWALILGNFVPLGLLFHYNKKLKEERANKTDGAGLEAAEPTATQKKARKRFILIWVSVVAYSLTAPIWLPITGVSLGTRGDFLVGVTGATMVSVIFAVRLKKLSNPTEPFCPKLGSSS
jgi:hypothetical protein